MATKERVQIVHVNQLVIRSNAKSGERNPPLCVRGKTRSQEIVYGHEVDLLLDGEVVGTFKYAPDLPLDCGAKVWFESTKLQVVPRTWPKEKTDDANEVGCTGEA